MRRFGLVGVACVAFLVVGCDEADEGDTIIVQTDGIPFLAEWTNSGHADDTAEAFRHWDGDGEVEVDCAKCHSESGFLDFLGADGSAAGTVEAAAPLGTVVSCEACHADEARALTSVTFPSTKVVTDLGSEARCMQCHQGRESTASVDADIALAAPTDDDTVDADLGFLNVHYFAAGATMYGSRASGGYEYDGVEYTAKFGHMESVDSCIECHDPHTLEVDLTLCATCHAGVTTLADLEDIRMNGSGSTDFDGDGNTTEGVYHEIEGLKTLLYSAIQAYATETSGTADIGYNGNSYPYWFIDTDGDGALSVTEAVYANGYNTWTARLVRATYNYQFSKKDPGNFVHNGHYVIQLLHSSIADLNTQLSTPIDLTNAVASASGHFDGSDGPFRDWDEDGAVPSGCSPCHGGAEGFRFYVEYGVGKEVPPSSGLECYTCHDTLEVGGTLAVDSVTFPNGTEVDAGDITNMCLVCHKGRRSMPDYIDDAIAASDFGLDRPHHHEVGPALFGADGNGGYEYPAKTYAGKWAHHGAAGSADCTYCHQVGAVGTAVGHTFDVATVYDNLTAGTSCKLCHTEAATVDLIRKNATDYDGDGDDTEPMEAELEGLKTALVAAMNVYCAANALTPVVYVESEHRWFNDTDGNGTEDGITSADRWDEWDAATMKAAYNYAMAGYRTPGSWAHNALYVSQLLVDSIEDLGGSVAAYTWR